MKEFADNIDFKVELNPDKVKELLEAGLIKGDKYLIKPNFINQSEEYSSISPFNYSKINLSSYVYYHLSS
jgi:hypothetical protein